MKKAEEWLALAKEFLEEEYYFDTGDHRWPLILELIKNIQKDAQAGQKEINKQITESLQDKLKDRYLLDPGGGRLDYSD